MEAHGADREPGSIYWREASKDELEPAGRPRSVDPEAVLALLPPEGLSAAGLKESAADKRFENMRKHAVVVKNRLGQWALAA